MEGFRALIGRIRRTLAGLALLEAAAPDFAEDAAVKPLLRDFLIGTFGSLVSKSI